jgi:hypothetical protein
MVIQNNVELANEGGLKGVNEHDVKELLLMSTMLRNCC